jgi:hypothetical protein
MQSIHVLVRLCIWGKEYRCVLSHCLWKSLGGLPIRISFGEIQPILCRGPVPYQFLILFHEYHPNIPQACSLVRRPRQHLSSFPSCSSTPQALSVEPVRKVLETSCALKYRNVLLRHRVLVLQSWHIALWMHSVVPFVFGVDDGNDIGELEFFCKDYGFYIVDVAGLVCWKVWLGFPRDMRNGLRNL